ncbi:DUF3696 domain-containing protein [Candidatus Laterigemmans baculatus]|uniref:DUF3696 domain-containing protein n=1 Tax=Candidatus Laterigemmans baculatus TaxID=2770505 RepID=UPI0013DAC6FB|nr:DUF3696 domain-containing protein [Candidatus Laterigemmans baculatus]
MITAIEIENFKCFGQRQRITVAPITLLFGANSAGKSSFFQSLFYLQQIFETYSANPFALSSFTDGFDLGGYSQVVFGHEIDREMTFRIECWVEEEEVHIPLLLRGQEEDAGIYSFGASEIAIELTVSIAEDGYGGIVRCFKLFADDKQLVQFEAGGLDELGKFRDFTATFFYENLEQKVDVPDQRENPWKTFYGYGALPSRYDPPLSAGVRLDDRTLSEEEFQFGREVDQFCSAAVECVRNHLNNLLYIGPVRQVPPPNYSPVPLPRLQRWASGLAAWDMLHYGGGDRIAQVNFWLGPDRLDTRINIEYQRLFARPDMPRLPVQSDQSPRIRLRPLVTGSATPGPAVLRVQDVGFGISQILPVVVALLVAKEDYVLVEQPELHLHPRLQTELGDLLIEACVGDEKTKRAIMETHSEHLILRVLRRIRETTDGELPDGFQEVGPGDVSVNYLEPAEEGTKIMRLRIDDDGEFVDRWPHGFFDERAEELF